MELVGPIFKQLASMDIPSVNSNLTAPQQQLPLIINYPYSMSVESITVHGPVYVYSIAVPL